MNFTVNLLAIGSGVLLAGMVYCNGTLAHYTTPTLASLAAHGVGSCVGLLICLIHSFFSRPVPPQAPSAPWWSYIGGIPGSLTVLLAGITVNSPLALSGTMSLLLLGQLTCSLWIDAFGLLGMPRRTPKPVDFLHMGIILLGITLLILSKKEALP